MATVCGMLTGRPGACYGTYGPGATNLCTGVGTAFLDRAPVLAFTTEAPERMRHRTLQMHIDHQALFHPLTKWTTRLQAANLRQTLRRAVQVATAEVPGPVHLGLPEDLGPQPMALAPCMRGGPATAPPPAARTVAGTRPPPASGQTATPGPRALLPACHGVGRVTALHRPSTPARRALAHGQGFCT